MKVREVMTSDVGYCQPDTSLTGAAMIMWQRDCGVVPVVNEQKRVIGMITDRDICIAVATKNRLASDIQVSEIISGKVAFCQPNDDVEDALKTMKKRQLRRLPVTDKDNVLLGIISMGDLLNVGKGKEIKKKLLAAIREITSFRPVHLHEITAEHAKHDGQNEYSNELDQTPWVKFVEEQIITADTMISEETEKPEISK
ncbi:MAG: CBS domain-containing protein [Pyrinomonadaceae bacterium]